MVPMYDLNPKGIHSVVTSSAPKSPIKLTPEQEDIFQRVQIHASRLGELIDSVLATRHQLFTDHINCLLDDFRIRLADEHQSKYPTYDPKTGEIDGRPEASHESPSGEGNPA
jgi:hypothetical protein